MKPQIVLDRTIAYNLDTKKVSVGGTLTSDNPLGGDPLAQPGGTYACNPPAEWSADGVLGEMRAAYPTCDVDWAPAPEAAAEPESGE